MSGTDVLETLFLSLKVGLLATLINLPLALGTVYFLVHGKMKGKDIIEGVISLPLVMPPVTTGYLLLFILGKKGLIGAVLFNLFGLRIAFTATAAVIASMTVSFPLVVRSIRQSMEMVDVRLEQAAMTLGANRASVFIRVTLPLIMPGVVNGVVLGFARSMGEFGATMTFAGNIKGETRTIPLSVYSFLQIPGKEKEAALLVTVSIVVSFAAMFLSSRMNSKTHYRRQRNGS
jgi:molybdate transport system permease protein